MTNADKKPSITIRSRPVKMLKILLPEWEENENLYQLHLKDLIDEVTHKVLLELLHALLRRHLRQDGYRLHLLFLRHLLYGRRVVKTVPSLE